VKRAGTHDWAATAAPNKTEREKEFEKRLHLLAVAADKTGDSIVLCESVGEDALARFLDKTLKAISNRIKSVERALLEGQPMPPPELGFEMAGSWSLASKRFAPAVAAG
jgi:hypothetical protein